MQIWGEFFHSKCVAVINMDRLFKKTLHFHFRLKWTGDTMYESSCSYQTALDLKRTSPIPQVGNIIMPVWTFWCSNKNFHNGSQFQVKSEECFGLTQCSPDWASYRFHQSTFEQLKQSVEKAKAVLQDRTGFLGTSAFR